MQCAGDRRQGPRHHARRGAGSERGDFPKWPQLEAEARDIFAAEKVCTRPRDNVRSIMDSGLIPGGPRGNRSAVQICPVMLWDTQYSSELPKFISIGPESVLHNVPGDATTQSTNRTALARHHILADISLSVITQTGTDLRKVALEDGRVRPSVHERWATQFAVDRFAGAICDSPLWASMATRSRA